jgi:RND family efflux transporter MFP subunit
MSQSGQPRSRRRWLNILINIVLSLAILGGSAYAVWVIYRTEPTAQQIKSKRKSAAIVETLTVQRDTYSPQLAVLGTVQPVQDIVLSPQVRGQVIELSPSFVPGGMVRKGEMLLNIDPADFENAVSVRQSELEQVKANWEIEAGRRKLAKQELDLLGDSIGGINRALVLREPQSASLNSQLSAANAAIERAKIDLKRTKLIAPFDAQVLRRSVNVGSQVGQGDDLGQLVGVDQYWVIAAIPVRNLRWVKFPSEGQPGSAVTLRNPDAWGPDAERQGRVERMIGALDQQTRLARVVVSVDDPLGQKSDVPPLILDTLIDVRIEGVALENIVRLDREFVHDRDTVWVMKDNLLEIRETKIAFRDAEYAYIRDGLETGEEVVTTTLATVANGVQLRKLDAPASELDADGELEAAIETKSPSAPAGAKE